MILLLWFFPQFFQPELQVMFSNLLEVKGNLYVAVYDREGSFLKSDQMCANKIVPIRHTGTMKVSLGNLPPGRYAVSCFHDMNATGNLTPIGQVSLPNRTGSPTMPGPNFVPHIGQKQLLI